ncbi:hypothetical protein ACIQXI_00840 [Lysinibacillus sp. NPDC097195]|uniref:hypothetical protein n=1 Tax=Lysinibacillus sp. NPDC097195 TaxID=3364141 RepID=UPI00380EAF6D
MTVKYLTKTFKDVTKKKTDALQVMTRNMPNDVIIKIYECKDTIIIHSKNDTTNHASLSHAKGYEHIQDWEIVYAIKHILKETNENVRVFVKGNGIIHICVKGSNVLIN